ncbi:MAG: YHS domain-containing (seleno)protein [Pseudomonadota bacterium]
MSARNILIAIGALAGLALAAFIALPAMAGNDRIYTAFLSDTALGGVDTVAYHTEGRQMDGKRAFSTKWRGAEWRFASEENRAIFLEDPERYAPAYGGYCAWAMADNRLAAGKPPYWKIVDGRLYLNYSASVKELWEKDIPGFIEKANANWPQIIES